MSCELCGLDLPRGAVQFCCSGCRAVFEVLKAKGREGQWRDDPVFLEAVKAGLIANPELLDEVAQDVETIRINGEIDGMWCPSCAELIRLVLLRKRGVVRCRVDYASDLYSVEFDPRKLSREEITGQICALGYQTLKGSLPRKSLFLRMGVALFCAFNLMMFATPVYAHGSGHLLDLFSLIFALPALCYSALPIFKRACTAALHRVWGMEVLVSIGVVSAFVLSCWNLRFGGPVYFDSMAAIIAFVLVGRLVELKAKLSARETLDQLTRTLPKRARKRLPDGSESFVLVKELGRGDTIALCSGEVVPVDGEVVEGQGACDESLLTGEPMPVSKLKGSHVVGGSVVQGGWLLVRVSGGESTLGSIVKVIGGDLETQGDERLVDRLTRWFVPFVLIVAGVAGLQYGLVRAMSVLLIACPCSIGIAVPLGEARLIARLAKMGIIVRNRQALHRIGKETLYAFDKTGTITEGKFKVEGEVSDAVRGLASYSVHPISIALQGPGLKYDEVEEIPGRGMVGRRGNQTYLLGSAQLMADHGHVVTDSGSLFFSDGGLPQPIKLIDKIRTDAAALRPACLISGDAPAAVAQVANECNFNGWVANASPLQKREWIIEQQAKGERVMMVGDGINDAPALTAADIGVSVISATDLSTQVSDLLLTTDRLEVLHDAKKVVARGRRITKQNLFWAFAYNLCALPLAFSGLLHPIVAAAAMVLSSLSVVFNSQRI